MRKVIILLALGVLAASSASASIPWAETFAYGDGNLTLNPGWLTHSGTGTDVQVLNGEAVLNSVNAPDDNYQFRASTEATATDVIYACFRLKITGTQTATGTYFAHFMNTGTFFAGRVFAALVDGTTYKLGINSTSTTPLAWSAALIKDRYYTIVIKYDAASGLSTMWIDPINELSPSLVGMNPVIGTLISGFALRQSSGYGIATIDDITVSSSFCTGEVPTTNSSWSAVKSDYR
jgi:hypothetical protein